MGAPLKDPINYKVMDYEVSLRRNEAALIEVVGMNQKDATIKSDQYSAIQDNDIVSIAKNKGNTINIALVGNPNAGKTSLFNLASGKHEHVGNYTGVTVDAKEGNIDYKGYRKGLTLFKVYGMNSIAAYMMPKLVKVRAVLAALLAFLPFVIGDAWSGLVISIASVVVQYYLLCYMYKREILLKV